MTRPKSTSLRKRIGKRRKKSRKVQSLQFIPPCSEVEDNFPEEKRPISDDYLQRKSKNSTAKIEHAFQNGEPLQEQTIDSECEGQTIECIIDKEENGNDLTAMEEDDSISFKHDGDHLYAKIYGEKDTGSCVLDMECETVSHTVGEDECERIKMFIASQKCETVNDSEVREMSETEDDSEVREMSGTVNDSEVREMCETEDDSEVSEMCETVNGCVMERKCETKKCETINECHVLQDCETINGCEVRDNGTTMYVNKVVMDNVLSEVTVETYTFSAFASDIRKCVRKRNYSYSILETENAIVLTKFYSSDCLAIKYTVKFDCYFNCTVLVHRKPISQSHLLWSSLPELITNVDSVLILLDTLESMNVCCGNTDTHYQHFVSIGDHFTGSESKIVAYREGDFGAIAANGVRYTSTIRSLKCEMLVRTINIKCYFCKKYRSSLNSRIQRMEEKKKSKRNFVHSQYKHKDMTREDLIVKIKAQRDEIHKLNQTLQRVENQLQKKNKKERQLEIASSIKQGSTVDTSSVDTSTAVDTSTVDTSTVDTSLTDVHESKPVTQDVKVNAGEKRPYKCNICKRKFTCENHLDRHTANYEGSCSSKSGNLKQHPKKPSAKKLYLCYICGQVCCSSYSLTKHIRTHTGERPYKCTMCDSAFIDGRTLRRHNMKHAGAAPLKCDHCEEEFSTLFDLKRHSKKHVEAQPFLCDICGSGFHERYKLTIHKRKHTGEKPFKCKICGAAFYQPNGIYQHKKIHTKKQFKLESIIVNPN
ncbi:hypothetical protein ACF0H5_021615 [Mactra antiquata]